MFSRGKKKKKSLSRDGKVVHLSDEGREVEEKRKGEGGITVVPVRGRGGKKGF